MRAVLLAGALALGTLAAVALLGACSRPLRMCTVAADCGALSSCVAGRCVTHGAVPAIATARRVLYDPVAIGYVRRGGPSGAPAIATLGRDRARDGALVFLRFSVPLPPEAAVVEAYVLIDPVAAVDADPVPVALHLARVLDAWDARSLSWAAQPRIEEVGSPVTRVFPAVATRGGVVRLDARGLVDAWRQRRRSSDLGIAIVAAGEGDAESAGTRATGMAFALTPLQPVEGQGAEHGPLDPTGGGDSARAPRLELYLR